MKIVSYTKNKNGFYKVRLEDDSYLLIHEELILKYELLLKKDLSENLKEKIYEENKKYLVYDEAVKYLSRKMRSVYQMKEFLRKKEYGEEIVDGVVELLLKQGYLNDLNYSKAFVHDKISLSNYGPFKIKQELRKDNIEEEYISVALELFTDVLEKERIIKLINKAIKTNHTKGKSFLKQKVLNDLMNLGYSKNKIVSYLYLIDDMDDEDIKKKEYEKLYSKLSKKYSGTELEIKIKQKLYQKGLL